MLTNYDARSVAEVMGIAFLRRSKAALPAPSSRRPGGESGAVADVAGGDFVIRVDDALVLVVEAGGVEAGLDKASLRPGRSGRRSGRHPGFEGGVVSSPSSALIERAVEKGLPRGALRHVAEWLAGGDKARASLLEWGVVPRTTLERRGTQLSPQESERTERVARLFVHARRALGTEAEAREFMTTPHPGLDARSPAEAARTDLGARRAEQILNALEYGLAL